MIRLLPLLLALSTHALAGGFGSAQGGPAGGDLGAPQGGVGFGFGPAQGSAAAAPAFSPLTDLANVAMWDPSVATSLEHSGTVLNGSSQYWTAASAFASGTPITVAVWFNPSAATNGMALWNLSDTATTDHKLEIQVMQGASDTLSILARASGAFTLTSTTNGSTVGEWNLAVAIFAADNDRTIVLNGDWASRGTSAVNRSPTGLDTTAIGVDASDTNQHYAGSVGRCMAWTAAPASPQAFVEALWDGDDPTGLELGAPDSDWFVRSTDGTDSGTPGGLNLTSTGSPTTHSDLYVVRDLGSGGYHVRAGQASAPTYTASGINGLGTITWTAANSDTLRTDVGNVPATVPPFSAWTVFTTSSATAAQGLVTLADDTVGNQQYILSARGDVAGDPLAARTQNGATDERADTTTGYTVSTVTLASGYWAALADREVEINGAGTATNTTSVDPGAMTRLGLGCLVDATPSSYLDGTSGATIFIPADATAGERTNVEGWYDDTWGTTTGSLILLPLLCLLPRRRRRLAA